MAVASNKRQKAFLLAAEQACEMAERVKDPEIKATWLIIAESYRQLAGHHAGKQ
jgi:hypothetical protein